MHLRAARGGLFWVGVETVATKVCELLPYRMKWGRDETHAMIVVIRWIWMCYVEGLNVCGYGCGMVVGLLFI